MSSKGSTPERCPSPLFSWTAARDHRKILRCYQSKRDKHIKSEVKEKAEELYVKGDEPSKEEEIPIEVSTDLGDTRPAQRNIKVEEQEGGVKFKEETIPIAISTDGPKDKSIPERCPHLLYSQDSTWEHHEIPEAQPLYSRDSTQEHHKILRCYQSKKLKQVKTEVKEEPEKLYLRGDDPCKKEEIPPEISTGNTNDLSYISVQGSSRSSYSGVSQRDVNAGQVEERGATFKEEKSPTEISPDTEDCVAIQRNIKTEEGKKQMKKKKNILEIGMDGRYRWYSMEKHPMKSAEGKIEEDDIAAYMAEEKATTLNLQPGAYDPERPFPCPDCGKLFSHESYLIIHRRSHTGERPFVCPKCGKRLKYKCSLAQHLAAHSAVGAFSCPECGKRCRTGWMLAAHRKHHNSKDIQR